MTTYIPADIHGFDFDPHWQSFARDNDVSTLPLFVQSCDIDEMTLPSTVLPISRYGQVTHTRTNSTTSDDNIKDKPTCRASAKEKKPNQPAETNSGRKRNNTKKNATSSDQGDDPEEAKRKALLEKNRLAAAKCRINKKEKTEQLLRDSHEKGLYNAILKEQVMRMKTEVQHLQAILLAHANCDSPKSPEEIQEHFATLSQEYVTNHMLTDAFDDYSNIQINSMSQRPHAEDYLSGSISPDEYLATISLLPEFNVYQTISTPPPAISRYWYLSPSIAALC